MTMKIYTYVVRRSGSGHDRHFIIASGVVYAVQLDDAYAVGQAVAVCHVGCVHKIVGWPPCTAVYAVFGALAASGQRLLVLGGRRRRRRCKLCVRRHLSGGRGGPLLRGVRRAVEHGHRFPNFRRGASVVIVLFGLARPLVHHPTGPGHGHLLPGDHRRLDAEVRLQMDGRPQYARPDQYLVEQVAVGHVAAQQRPLDGRPVVAVQRHRAAVDQQHLLLLDARLFLAVHHHRALAQDRLNRLLDLVVHHFASASSFVCYRIYRLSAQFQRLQQCIRL